MAISEWYRVRFDDRGLYRSVEPPEGEGWSDSVAWDDIRRICLEVEDFVGTGALYVFTQQRPESYAIPMEAEGAVELLAELVRRGHFDGDLALEAASAELGLFCWPK